MKNHVLIGHNILNNNSSELLQMGAVIALTHFNALISPRPYKKAWKMETAINFLKKFRDTV